MSLKDMPFAEQIVIPLPMPNYPPTRWERLLTDEPWGHHETMVYEVIKKRLGDSTRYIAGKAELKVMMKWMDKCQNDEN